MWNLQIHQAREYEENCETVTYDDNRTDEVVNNIEEVNHNDELVDSPYIALTTK